MLKKILSIALVIAIVGSAVGFFIYDKVGKTFDYDGKDMTKYLSIRYNAAKILALKDNDKIQEEILKLDAWRGEIQPDDPEVGYKIAAMISGVAAAKKEAFTGGTLSLYDTMSILFYIELADGTVVSNPALMNPSGTKPTFQLGADPESTSTDSATKLYAEIAGLLSSQLNGMKYDLIQPIYSGRVEETDTIWVTYTITETDAEGKKTSTTYVYQKTTLADLDNLESGTVDITGLKDGFDKIQEDAMWIKTPKKNDKGEEIKDENGNVQYDVEALPPTSVPKVIGVDHDIKLSEKISVKFKVNYAFRAIATKGNMYEGDTVYFTYKEKGTSTSNQMKVTIGADGKVLLNGKIGDGDKFYEALFATNDEGVIVNKIEDVDSKEFKIPVTANNTTKDKTYVVTIDYVAPVDPTDTNREGLLSADPMLGGAAFEIHLGEDSAATKYDATGKEVTEGEDKKVVELKNTDVKVYVYVVSGSHLDLDSFDKYYTTLAYTATGDEKLDAFLKAESLVRTEEAKDSPNEATLEKNKKDRDTKWKEYNESIGEAPDRQMDSYLLIKSEFEKEMLKQAQTDANNDRAYDLAKVVWDYLIAEVKAKGIDYPSKAVNLAKKGILDDLKAEYYPNREKDDYAGYKSFNDFLENGSEYKDNKDVDAAIEKEAKRIVLETMMFHYLKDIYKVKLTEDQKNEIDNLKRLEAMYSGFYFNTAAREQAYLFDNTMRAIAEAYEPDLKLPE